MSIQIIQSSEETWDVMTANHIYLGVIWRRGTKLFNRPPYEYLWKSSIGSGSCDRRKFGGTHKTFIEAEENIKAFYVYVAKSILEVK